MDAFVAQRSGGAPKPPAVPMKRMTIDVPLDLHTKMKAECARRGLKMADILREFIEREFGAKA